MTNTVEYKANTGKQEKAVACYIRLSREDGDKTESLSIANQRLKLTDYVNSHSDLSDCKVECYVDDGYTGTNFNRPAFLRLQTDIEAGKISAVVVKDLSRLGRNLTKATELVQEYFPSKKVRFIAIDDGIDKQYYQLDNSEDMLIEMKNMFNGFYPRDISKKVRSSFRAKQRAGQFIGAFACYGYKKDPLDHNRLIIDEPAAQVVRQIFNFYLSGLGQQTIAKKLNAEHIPCPSEYKRQNEMNYRNGNRLDSTTYWTYSSVRNILRQRIYTGATVQNTSFRQICKKQAVKLPKDQWIVVEGTHEAIIDKTTFEKVQKLLTSNTRELPFKQNVHIFAGLVKCGDCGRAMVKVTRKGCRTFACGSYHRYGTDHCSAHSIDVTTLEEIVRNDFNAILASLDNLKDIIAEQEKQLERTDAKQLAESVRLENEINRLIQKKHRAYEDYSEDLISKDEYLKYKEKYDTQTDNLKHQLEVLSADNTPSKPTRSDWIDRLLSLGYVEKLDRTTVVEMVNMIYIYEDNTIKIIYNFSDELGDLIG